MYIYLFIYLFIMCTIYCVLYNCSTFYKLIECTVKLNCILRIVHCTLHFIDCVDLHSVTCTINCMFYLLCTVYCVL